MERGDSTSLCDSRPDAEGTLRARLALLKSVHRPGIYFAIAAALICAVPHLLAQSLSSTDFEGRRVEEVIFSPASYLDPADLEWMQPIRSGATLRNTEVAAAIDSLFASGRFVDIVVEAE